MSELIVGLFFLLIAALGNVGAALELIGADSGFVIWAVAVIILDELYDRANGQYREPIRATVLAIVAGILIVNFAKIKQQIITAFNELKNIGNPSAAPIQISNLTAPAGTPISTGIQGSTINNASSSFSGYSNIQNFVNQYGPIAQQVAQQVNVPVSGVLAQWGLETGWGQSVPGNNLGGVSGVGNVLPTQQFVNGQMVNTTQSFAAYSSPQAFGNAFSNLLATNYPNAINTGSNVQAYAQGLQSGGYATDPAYASKIISIASNPILANYGSSGVYP